MVIRSTKFGVALAAPLVHLKPFLISLLLCCLLSGLASAQKPVKLTEREMAEVEGAKLPKVVQSLFGDIKLGLAFDLATDPDYWEAWVDTGINIYHKDWDAAAKSSQLLKDKGYAMLIGQFVPGYEVMTDFYKKVNPESDPQSIPELKQGPLPSENGFKNTLADNSSTGLKTETKLIGSIQVFPGGDAGLQRPLSQQPAIRSNQPAIISDKQTNRSDILQTAKEIGRDGLKFAEAVMPRTTQAVKDGQQEVANKISQAKTAQYTGGSGGGGSSGRSSSTAVTFDSNRVLANISRAQVASAAPASKTTYIDHAAEDRVDARSYVRTIADNRADVARRTAAISGTSTSKSTASNASSSKASSSSRSSSSGKR